MRLANTSWPLFRAFRVDVRVSWTILIMPLVFAVGFASWLPFEQALAWGGGWTLALYACVWTHEMGHIAMGRRCGIETDRMTLRALGGLAHLDAPAQSPRDEILIALAGPATHLVWMAVLFPLTWAFETAHGYDTWFSMLHGYALLQLWMLVFNVLPIYPMDGGRTLRGLLSLKIDASRASWWTANAGFLGNGALVVLGLLASFGAWDPFHHGRYGAFLAWIGIEGIRACMRLRLEARYGDPYGERDSFQSTLVASQSAMRELDREELAEREARRAAREERRRMEETADRLLDRINEVGGIDNLPEGERRELERVSRALAKEP